MGRRRPARVPQPRVQRDRVRTGPAGSHQRLRASVSRLCALPPRPGRRPHRRGPRTCDPNSGSTLRGLRKGAERAKSTAATLLVVGLLRRRGDDAGRPWHLLAGAQQTSMAASRKPSDADRDVAHGVLFRIRVVFQQRPPGHHYPGKSTTHLPGDAGPPAVLNNIARNLHLQPAALASPSRSCRFSPSRIWSSTFRSCRTKRFARPAMRRK